MPYFFKSSFLTVSYIVLMYNLADLRMFFLSLLIFVGGILFDLYFSYVELENLGETDSVKWIKIILCILVMVAVVGLIVSVLGLAQIILVTHRDNVKYIMLDEKILKGVGVRLNGFLLVMGLEVLSCLPDFFVHRIKIKEQNKEYRTKMQNVTKQNEKTKI